MTATSGTRTSWRGKNLASDPERERLRAPVRLGAHRPGARRRGRRPGTFSYWDYTAGAFHKGWGLRIDLALGVGADRRASDVGHGRARRAQAHLRGGQAERSRAGRGGPGVRDPGILVDAAWLSGNLKHPGVAVIDVRWSPRGSYAVAKREYEDDHIPGAAFLDVDRDLAGKPFSGGPGRHPLPDPDRFAAKMSVLGIDDEMLVVAYDDVRGLGRGPSVVDALGHGAPGGVAGRRPRGLARPGRRHGVRTDGSRASGSSSRASRGRPTASRRQRGGVDDPCRERAGDRCPGRRAVPGRDRALRSGRGPHPGRAVGAVDREPPGGRDVPLGRGAPGALRGAWASPATRRSATAGRA